jgi:predicted protein tyrosine phosphatase
VDQLRSVLDKHLPENAVDYCHQLWQQYPFHFKLSKKRSSKLGDYRYDPRDQSHTVTVNADLNPYQFLITYVHEVAHRVAHKHRSRQKPHGPEWKSKFRELMLPVLRPEIFPDELLRTLARHMRNPKASTAGDPALVKVLAGYDEGSEAIFTLGDLPLGEEFLFRKRAFRKLEKKRTRSVCLDLVNNKKYLIPEMAAIAPAGEIVKPVRLLLSSLEAGQEFTFKQRPFRKLEIKGKRSLCLDLSDNTVYSIPESMEVSQDKS